MLESRMREGFVRIRQLLVMTRHEIRLRGPFDPVPYSCLAASCERFFEYLIAVRQSALFYNPDYIRDNPIAAEKLLSYRRDAVASILSNLYTLAGALKDQRKVPVSSRVQPLVTPLTKISALSSQRRRSEKETPAQDCRGCQRNGRERRIARTREAKDME